MPPKNNMATQTDFDSNNNNNNQGQQPAPIKPTNPTQWRAWFSTHPKDEITVIFGSTMNPPTPAHKEMIIRSVKALRDQYGQDVKIRIKMLPVHSHMFSEKQGDKVRPYEDRMSMAKRLADDALQDLKEQNITNVEIEVSDLEETLANTPLAQRKHAIERYDDANVHRITPGVGTAEYTGVFRDHNPDGLIYFLQGDDAISDILAGKWADALRIFTNLDGLIVTARPPATEQDNKPAQNKPTSIVKIETAIQTRSACFKPQDKVLPEHQNDLNGYADKTNQRITELATNGMILAIGLPASMNGLSSTVMREKCNDAFGPSTRAKKEAAREWLQNPLHCIPGVLEYMDARPYLFAGASYNRPQSTNYGMRGAPPTQRDWILIEQLARKIHKEYPEMSLEVVIVYHPDHNVPPFTFEQCVDLSKTMVQEISKKLALEGIRVSIKVSDNELHIYNNKLQQSIADKRVGTVDYMLAQQKSAKDNRQPIPVYSPAYGVPTFMTLLKNKTEEGTGWRDPSRLMASSRRMFVLGSAAQVQEVIAHIPSLEAYLPPVTHQVGDDLTQQQIMQRVNDATNSSIKNNTPFFVPVEVTFPEILDQYSRDQIQTMARDIINTGKVTKEAGQIFPACVLGGMLTLYFQQQLQSQGKDSTATGSMQSINLGKHSMDKGDDDTAGKDHHHIDQKQKFN